MNRLILLVLPAISLLLLAGCGSAPVARDVPVASTDVRAADEPCWVRKPACMTKPGEKAVYFVGQSEKPLASYGRPQRDSFHSAQRDAERQYARFLGVDIGASTYLRELFNNQSYQSQFRQTVKEDFQHSVSDITKEDEYFVAYHETSDGEPLWTVYVLIRIDEAMVQKHREATLAEAERRRNEPPPPAEWVAHVFNIDDSVSIYVNGTKVNQCNFSQSCEVSLNKYFQPGNNKVKLEYTNHAIWWAYGYEIRRDEEVMYKASCGQVWLSGCNWGDTTLGVVHEFEFDVAMPES